MPLQDLRLDTTIYTPRILQALQSIDFKFQRACSYSNIIFRERNISKGETLLMFWACNRCESRFAMSMSTSSCSSVHMPLGGQNNHRDKELRTSSQQTDISCRSSGLSSPVSSLLQPGRRSMSILGSVCALLLNKSGSTRVPKAVSSLTSSISDNICRICFGGESVERLVRPCSCRGTIAAVHRTCLERWLLQAATSYCELCRHHYVVTRSHKWSWVRSLAQWAASGRGRALWADAWRGAALCACSAACSARALHACDAALRAAARRGAAATLAANVFSSLLIGAIGALNGLLTMWLLLKIQEHQLSWQAWRDSTQYVHVTLADEEQTLTPRSSDATVVAGDRGSMVDRSTNVADPFMVAFPYTLPDQ